MTRQMRDLIQFEEAMEAYLKQLPSLRRKVRAAIRKAKSTGDATIAQEAMAVWAAVLRRTHKRRP